MNHGWQSEATDGPKGGWCLLSFSLFLSLSLSFSDYLPTYLQTKKICPLYKVFSAEMSKLGGPKRQGFLNPGDMNCRLIFANISFSQVWKHSSYTYAIPWCVKIWAWLRHEFLETAIPWWSTSKFWPRHELGMSLSFDCTLITLQLLHQQLLLLLLSTKY